MVSAIDRATVLYPTQSRPQTPFGLALRKDRRDTGITQAELARRCGYDHSFISRLESGDRNPTPTNVRLIVEALDGDEWMLARLLIAAFVPAEGRTRLAVGTLLQMEFTEVLA
jgi:transcriptional regulator with XRE-family HTH domain